MISCIIDMMEVRGVVAAEIPGAYLQFFYDKGDIHINIEGDIVTLLEDIDPSYYKYFICIYTYIAAVENVCM